MSQTKGFHLDLLKTYPKPLNIPYYPSDISQSRAMQQKQQQRIWGQEKAGEENKSSYTYKYFTTYNNNEDDNENVHYMPVILPGALHMLSLILTTTL